MVLCTYTSKQVSFTCLLAAEALELGEVVPATVSHAPAELVFQERWTRPARAARTLLDAAHAHALSESAGLATRAPVGPLTDLTVHVT